jgi:hypothetical protein
LEDLLEQQRKDFVSSMTTPAPAASKKKWTSVLEFHSWNFDFN